MIHELSYRPAKVEDFEQCLAIDHSFQTNRIWQMIIDQQPDAVRLRFQAVRLPKSTTIPYPHTTEQLSKRWWEAHWFLVGEYRDEIQGYITAVTEKLRPVVWIEDMAVAPAFRRKGHGSHLLHEAARWAKQENARYLMVSLPMKNDPAMQFLKKNGFTFCGYNEAHYQQKDIDLYFSAKL